MSHVVRFIFPTVAPAIDFATKIKALKKFLGLRVDYLASEGWMHNPEHIDTIRLDNVEDIYRNPIFAHLPSIDEIPDTIFYQCHDLQSPSSDNPQEARRLARMLLQIAEDYVIPKPKKETP